MDGKGDAEEGTNVIRLPRDWIGPPDELVPMGPRARARARERARERETQTGRETQADGGRSAGSTPESDLSVEPSEAGADAPGTPDPFAGVPAATGFWSGETTGEVHHAVHAPGTRAPRSRDRRAVRLRLRLLRLTLSGLRVRRAEWSRDPTRRPADGIAASRHSECRNPHVEASPPRVGSRDPGRAASGAGVPRMRITRPVAAGLAAVAILVALVVAGVNWGMSHDARGTSATDQVVARAVPHGSVARSTAAPKRKPATVRRTATRRMRARADRRAVGHRRRVRSHHAARRREGNTRPTVVTQTVTTQQAAPSPTTPTPAAPVATGPVATSASDGGGASGSSAATSGSSSGSASSSAGPAGPLSAGSASGCDPKCG